MKLVKHTKFIYEYENFVSSEDCERIISLIQAADICPEWLFKKSKTRNNTAINLTKYSDSDNNIKEAENIIHQIFSTCNIFYVRDNIFASFVVNKFMKIDKLTTNYVYRSYDNNEYYDWHIDYDDVNHNLFSYILYLNDDFEGGNTFFLNDKLKIIPKQGSMLCFPCDFYSIHKSSKIYKGNKKIIWSCVYKE